jgi:hypothetical protein
MSDLRTVNLDLPALSDEDRAMLRALGAGQQTPSEDEAVPRYRHALQVAAFLGDFDPTVLLPDVSEQELNKLLTDCTVSAADGRARWRLSAGVRQRILREHGAGPALRVSLTQAQDYLARSGGHADPLTAAFLQIASGEAPDGAAIAAAGPVRWAAYRSALTAVKGTPLARTDIAAVLSLQVALAELLAPFRFLTGWDARTGTDLFVGREDTLRQLRAFVDVLGAQGIAEVITRGAKRLFGERKQTMVLSGIGGTGKSTLIAKFVLQHTAREGDAAPLYFAYLDFDRATISPLQPGALLSEIARQLSWQVPAAANELELLARSIDSAIAASIRDAGVRDGSDTLPPEVLGTSALHRYAALVRQSVARADSGKCILVVLDTFEEAQALGSEAVTRVETLTAALAEDPAWRILIAGRDEADDAFAQADRLVLDELDAPSRREFLHRRGVMPTLSSRIAKDVGGRPLALLLAAQLVSEGHYDSVKLSLAERAKGLFRRQLTEGVLYQRIIEHIRDSDVRTIAHPGLVLRRLDVDVLLEVVAPVLDLHWLDRARAEKVLVALRLQKDLVRTLEDGSVAHRADVRRQMLRLMAEDKPSLTTALHRRAVDYYARRSEYDPERQVRHRTEEIYHRLCLAEDPHYDLDEVTRRWLPGCRLGLGNAVDDMFSTRGKAALQLKLGKLPKLADVESLTPWLANEYAQRAVTNAVAYDDPISGIEALGRVGWALDVKAVQRDFCLLHDRAGDWRVAQNAYSRWLHESNWSDESVLAAADFLERADGVSANINEMDGILIRLENQRAIASQLAAFRLRLRLNKHRDLSGSPEFPRPAIGPIPSLWPDGGAGGREVQWIYALNLAPAFAGRGLLFGLCRTPRGRLQLEFLTTYLYQIPDEWRWLENLRRLCSRLSGDQTMSQREFMRVLDEHGYEAAELLLLHLARPATPQWYVPIAQALLHQLGAIDAAVVFFHQALPQGLLPGRVAGTRSLSDVLAHLDSFGLLGFMLRRLTGQLGVHPMTHLSNMLATYDGWRNDVLGHLDSRLAGIVGPAPAEEAEMSDVGLIDAVSSQYMRDLQLRFFQELSQGDRLKAFVEFGVIAQLKGRFDHSMERRLFRRAIRRGKAKEIEQLLDAAKFTTGEN